MPGFVNYQLGLEESKVPQKLLLKTRKERSSWILLLRRQSGIYYSDYVGDVTKDIFRMVNCYVINDIYKSI